LTPLLHAERGIVASIRAEIAELIVFIVVFVLICEVRPASRATLGCGEIDDKMPTIKIKGNLF
jgi:hypothetical protein